MSLATVNFNAMQFSASSPLVHLVPLPTEKAGPATSVGYMTLGQWVKYSAVDFGIGVTTFNAQVAVVNKYEGQKLQLRIDSITGPIIGTLTVQGTVAWYNYTAQSTPVVNVIGVHDLYLISEAAISGCCNIASFSFVGVPKTNPTITWNDPVAFNYGTPLSSQLNATASVAGTFVYTPPTGTILTTGSHSLSVAFTPTDVAHYNPVTKSVTVVVNQVTPVVTWNNPADINVGALTATQLNATASVAGTFVYTPPVGTVLTAGTHTLSVTFTPNNSTLYTTATATTTISVTKVNPIVTWQTPAPVITGTTLNSTQLNATANVAGAFTYTPAAGVILTKNQNLSVLFTPTNTAEYNNVNYSVAITINSAEPVNLATLAIIKNAAIGSTVSVPQSTYTLDATLIVRYNLELNESVIKYTGTGEVFLAAADGASVSNCSCEMCPTFFGMANYPNCSFSNITLGYGAETKPGAIGGGIQPITGGVNLVCNNVKVLCAKEYPFYGQENGFTLNDCEAGSETQAASLNQAALRFDTPDGVTTPIDCVVNGGIFWRGSSNTQTVEVRNSSVTFGGGVTINGDMITGQGVDSTPPYTPGKMGTVTMNKVTFQNISTGNAALSVRWGSIVNVSTTGTKFVSTLPMSQLLVVGGGVLNMIE